MAEEPQRQPRNTEIIGPSADADMEAARSLGEMAVNNEMTVMQERSLFGDLITAQPLKVQRHEARILQKIDIYASIAGSQWYYRYPVKNRRTGRVDYIEGPSVKCTNEVARLFGNCAIESRTVRLDDKQYVCYSRFGDHETGFSITKGQLVPRSATLGGEDEERRQQIAHNVGQSKSQRNVIDAALGTFTRRGFESAKASIVEKIGRNIERARERIVTLLNELGRDKGITGIVPRVEYIKGKPVADWLAPDIAGIHGELEFITDGMASIDETWPLPAPPEPRRDDDDVTDLSPAGSPKTTPGAAAEPPHPAAAAAPAADPAHPSAGSEPAFDNDPAFKKNWTLPPDLLGQDAVLRGLEDLLEMTSDEAELNELVSQNAERINKITGQPRMQWNAKVRARRESFGSGDTA